MRALLSFQDLYVGLSPFEAPAVFSLLQAMELGIVDADDDDDAGEAEGSAPPPPRPRSPRAPSQPRGPGPYGVRYPMGGFGEVLRKLEARCDALGVTVRRGVTVRQIELSPDGSDDDSNDGRDGDAEPADGGAPARARGVRIAPSSPRGGASSLFASSPSPAASGDAEAEHSAAAAAAAAEAEEDCELFAADLVVCNADVPVAEAALLPRALSRAAALRGAASSSSVVSLSFALDARFDALAHHTICFGDDLGAAPWEALFGQ